MIYIGTSGFSYEDWKGTFYPERMGKKDMLQYYCQHFNTVEINSTYYAIPGIKAMAGLAEKTPQDFLFAIKAHKDITHTDEPIQSSLETFTRAIRPIAEAGKLGCVLVQYPWSFKRTVPNTDRVKSLKDFFPDTRLVVEFRNADWIVDETFDLLKGLDLAFCAVDEPELKGLVPPVCAATSCIGYVRFHGRNAEKWWKNDEAWQRYDYLYSQGELQEWVPKIESITRDSDEVYLYFNNHYKGKSAVNAKQLADMLGLPSKPQLPPNQLSLM